MAGGAVPNRGFGSAAGRTSPGGGRRPEPGVWVCCRTHESRRGAVPNLGFGSAAGRTSPGGGAVPNQGFGSAAERTSPGGGAIVREAKKKACAQCHFVRHKTIQFRGKSNFCSTCVKKISKQRRSTKSIRSIDRQVRKKIPYSKESPGILGL